MNFFKKRDVYKVEQVFGVSKDHVLSYVERADVDGMFLEAIKTDKQVIVYGASKQGKTSLVEKHLPYKENILVSLTPKFQLIDIYKSILQALDVEIVTGVTKSKTNSSDISVSAKVNIKIPYVGGGESVGGMKSADSSQHTIASTPIEINLSLPNDIALILKKINNKKVIVLENFHYLDEDIQRQFSFDLRSFQELGVRFIILGVWREKNRLIQFNGDLLDRLVDVPVEPWSKDDFEKVVNCGASFLNVEFSYNLTKAILESAFDSIGVVQELLRTVCINANVKETQDTKLQIDNEDFLQNAIAEKADAYAARHTRALEAIAEGRKSSNIKSDDPKDMPLYLSYYAVRAFLEFEFNDVVKGIKRNTLEQKIKEIHHRPDDVRPSDMSNLLHGFAKLQSEKFISPPIFDYDQTTRTIRVIDSTFYFFLRNSDREVVLASILDPTRKN